MKEIVITRAPREHETRRLRSGTRKWPMAEPINARRPYSDLELAMLRMLSDAETAS